MKIFRACALPVGSLLVCASLALPAFAQANGGGCVVEQAAQAALDRQIKAIEAAQTDVSSFFKGENSCINADLLNMIDFSQFIQDPLNMLSQIGNLNMDQLLNQAVQKACEVANEQIADVTGNLNSSFADWDSGLDDQIKDIISDGQVRIP